MTAVEPLWGESTEALFHEWVSSGADALIVTARAEFLDHTWLGRPLRAELLPELQRLGVDPCGERGEYHTVVTDSPLFDLGSAPAKSMADAWSTRDVGVSILKARTMLRATDLSFSYDNDGARPILDGVSLHVERGAIVGLLGPNGSGKTTLLRIVSGMLKPRPGTVILDGEPVSALTRRRLAQRLAVVPQETHSTFDFTVLDIVLMGRYPHLGAFELEGAADLSIARDALAATGTEALAERAFATLSGGEKQRVVIASALAQQADVLLLDEPTASLDLGYQFEVASLLQRLNRERGTTMVVSTHDLNLAAALCARVVLLKEGRVLAQGPTTEVLTEANIRSLYGVDADVRFTIARVI